MKWVLYLEIPNKKKVSGTRQELNFFWDYNLGAINANIFHICNTHVITTQDKIENLCFPHLNEFTHASFCSLDPHPSD